MIIKTHTQRHPALSKSFNYFLVIFFIVIYSTQSQNPRIKLGIDVLSESGFEILKAKKVALLSNFSGRNSNGELTAKILADSDSLSLTAIVAPEHGFNTTVPAGEAVGDDEMFGVPVLSLYNISRKPTKSQMDKFDVLVVDIQDIGIRSYTYISTVFYLMQSCAKFNKPVIILDRPNPLGGMIVDGGTVKKGKESFVSIIPVSYLHGCTIGELAEMINNEGWLSNDAKLKCDLTVIKMSSWERWMHWEDTGLKWYPTSPHIPTVNAVRGAAAMGLFGELGIMSIGIGTTLPFQYIGSPDFNSPPESVIERVSNLGIELRKIVYRPFYGMYSGKNCNGYFLDFKINNNARYYSAGITLFEELGKINPLLFGVELKPNSIQMFEKVSGGIGLLDYFRNKKDKPPFEKANEGRTEFIKLRQNYLIY